MDNWLHVLREMEDCLAVDCVLSEPYFASKEGQEPWMHYFVLKYCIEQLRDSECLAENCQIYPSSNPDLS